MDPAAQAVGKRFVFANGSASAYRENHDYYRHREDETPALEAPRYTVLLELERVNAVLRRGGLTRRLARPIDERSGRSPDIAAHRPSKLPGRPPRAVCNPCKLGMTSSIRNGLKLNVGDDQRPEMQMPDVAPGKPRRNG